MDTDNKISDNLKNTESWDMVIEPKNKLFQLPFKELWKYRELIGMFVRRDLVSVYKQTILGPLWYIIQPLLSTLTYLIVFTGVAKISTGGAPSILFYLLGITCWNFFSNAVLRNSNTFVTNAGLFGKVYFPRMIAPIANTIGSLISFFIQFAVFLVFYAWYLVFSPELIHASWALLLTPVLLLIMSVLGLGIGIIFTSLTTKYRDLALLLSFGMQLLMYATPVIYPLSFVGEKYQFILKLNPMTAVLETFKYAYLGAGVLDINLLLYSGVVSVLLLFVGFVLFNRVEKTFMDSI